VKSNIQLKYSNYVAFSHIRGKVVNNSGLFSQFYPWFDHFLRFIFDYFSFLPFFNPSKTPLKFF